MKDTWELRSKRPWLRPFQALLRNFGKPGRAADFLSGATLRYAERWGWEENIQGLCLTKKRSELRITFLVRRKIHEARLSKQEFIPELLRHKALNLEIPTRVWEVGDKLGLAAPYGGTLKRGLAVGHGRGYPSGTLGFVVERTVNGAPVRSILSCAHVLAWTLRGRSLPRAGDLVEQPVSLDSDPQDFLVAKLAAGFSDLTKQVVRDDFALADILPGVRHQQIGTREVSARRRPDEYPSGLQVQMHGRVSGKVLGRVRGVEASVRLPSRGNVNFPAWNYQKLMVYEVENAEGDSGAAIHEVANGHATGLHVGGNQQGLGLFYPVRPVFDLFGLRLG